ncbi:MAG: DUF1800 family protein, partial [Verrucomicrobiota bacterium]
ENRFRENRENQGINENYGREILELSTVGVEAGYTPADVDMVSRVFSGWRYERTNPNAENTAQLFEFAFFPEDHDPQDKLIPFLGTTITGREGAAGVQEGEELIALLANHPNTQSRTCRKLVQLLVADDGPAGFVQSCVAAWGVDGDIDAMLRAILLNPAYVNTAAYQRNKAKTPFEYSVSVIRAFGARPDNVAEDGFWNRFREAHEQAGYNFVRFPVPTGLPEVSAAWLNSASMIASYNRVTDVIESRQNYGIDPRPASAMSGDGAEYDFNEPLLENLLGTEGFEREVVLSMLFISPGRHAGPGGDIAEICEEAEAKHPGLRTAMTDLVASHDQLIEILVGRYREGLSAAPFGVGV